jgi:hypothetical protein
MTAPTATPITMPTTQTPEIAPIASAIAIPAQVAVTSAITESLIAHTVHGAAARRTCAAELRADQRRDPRAEQLHRAQHVGVSDRADAHLGDVALVAEQRVLGQDLLGDLLRRADRERPGRRAQRLILGPARRRPAALAPDPVHHRR